MGYDEWLTTDPDLEAPRCPECDSGLEGDKYEGHCTNEECDFAYETDYEYLIEMRNNHDDDTDTIDY